MYERIALAVFQAGEDASAFARFILNFKYVLSDYDLSVLGQRGKHCAF